MKAQRVKCDRHDPSDGGLHNSLSVAADERKLVSAAKNGDSVSFEILCKQSANMVFRVARRITPTMEDAEDVVQESFQLAFINLKKFKGNCRFSTWLTRIVTNAALMRLRKNRVRRELPLEEPSKYQPHRSPYQVEDQRLNPEQLYAQEEQHRMLVEAVNALDPGLRWAMELRELDERSTAEAAHMMGVPLGTLKARLFRGRRRLRQLLNRMEPAQLTREVNYSWGRQMRYSDSD
jgi:RNA polymerase sigma-70 factor, ECF subfamily